MSQVSITRCTSYEIQEVYRAVKESIDLLGGMDRFVSMGERILLKPNLLAGKPPETAVTTHPEVVRVLIRLVKEAGGVPVVGDSPGLGAAMKVADKCGVGPVCREEGVELVDLKTLVVAENPGGRTFKRLEVAKEALDCDGIINIPKLKTHAQMFLTLGVKNLFGCVPGKLKPQWHLSAGVESSHFAAMLLDLYAFLHPRLTVMDGVVGMEGNGPGAGDPRKIGLVFAGADAVALDTVAATVLGAHPHDLPLLKAAAIRGLNTDINGIEVLGEEISNVKVHGFKFAPLVSLNFADRLPHFLDRRLRRALTSRPSVERAKCTLCNICVQVCPAEVMTKTERIGIDYDRCIRCYCCQEMCPEGAIAPVDGWLKRLIPGF
ncbi:MAG: hypothetical protein A2X99_04615 [Deltaproteobacteria bacterium GWB2_55_19]|nr:MAG: hypothetical protein A2X99_04615 [Deltaproteobacteria bacterium GWB2_55_19]HAO94174.1 (4Fe-4S)-binding protein [Deltaproteobacteria bacterium]